ncbi:MAG: hypothetical protein K6G15_03555 [Desulfovibrio sp.]|nr:hypothetical protein [Desulfovibrio sp.]
MAEHWLCKRQRLGCALLVSFPVWLALALQPLWGRVAYAAESMGEVSFGQLRKLCQEAELLEETKRVRRLQAEIAELEAKEHNQGKPLERKEIEALVQATLQKLLARAPEKGQSSLGGASLPRILAIERGIQGKYAAWLCWPDGQRQRVTPNEQYRGLAIVAISRERVLVRVAGNVLELAFAK